MRDVEMKILYERLPCILLCIADEKLAFEMRRTFSCFFADHNDRRPLRRDQVYGTSCRVLKRTQGIQNPSNNLWSTQKASFSRATLLRLM